MLKKLAKKCPKCGYEIVHITDTLLKSPGKCTRCKTTFIEGGDNTWKQEEALTEPIIEST